MNQQPGACIDREILTRYVQGQLVGRESSEVSLHLAGCELCVRTCDSLTTVADEFEAELISIRNRRESPLHPACEIMLERIQRAHPTLASLAENKPEGHGSADMQLTAELSTAFDQANREVQPATCFGRYTIIGRLGAGGMAAVFHALDNRLNRHVALKLPHRSIQADPVARARFQQEGHAAAAVNHPNVCGVLDIGEFEGLWYLTMPLLEGESLAERLKSDPPLELAEALRVVCDLCAAVDAVHARGVIHRDIKPANIFLTTAGQVLLMDFGIALANQTQERLTRTDLLMGTPAYFSPEQAAGAWSQVGPSADIYALGVVLYELLGGQPPFSGPPGVIIGNILHQAPPPLVSRYPECNQLLVDICERAMAKNQAERYGNGAAFRAAIQDWLTARSRVAGVSTRNSSRLWKVTLAGGIAGGIVLVFLMISYQSRWGDREIATSSPLPAGPDRPQAPKNSQQPEAPQTPEPVRRGTLAALDPRLISVEHRRALSEFSHLPDGMKWVACLGPDQLSLTTDQAQSPAGIQMATISGDGTTLALLHDGPIATIWDLPTLTRSSVLPLPKNDTTMTLSIDGSRLLTAGGGWRVRVWDLTSSRELAALPGHTNWINTLAIDESGQRAASSSKDGTVRCWDVSRQELRWTNPHGSWTRSVAISQRGDRIASGGNDGLVKFWKADTGEAEGGFQASNRPLIDLRFSNGTELLSTLDIDGNLSVWELDGNRLRWSLATRPLHTVRFSADGERIACTAMSGSLTVLNTASGRSEWTLLDSVVERSWNVVGFSNDDRHMIIRSADGYISVLQYEGSQL